jgi:hypothetical protein
VEPLDRTASRALRALLDAQPLTEAKVGFAWKIAAGPPLARATSIRWSSDGRLRVRARTEAWRREVTQARPILLQRMTELLGPGAVRALVVDKSDGS